MNSWKFLLLQPVLILVGLVLIFIIKRIYTKMVATTTPSGKQLEEYVKKAKEMKALEMPYQDRLKYFRKQGLLKNAAEKILILADQDELNN